MMVSRYIKVNKVNLFVREHGVNRPLVFIHGALGDTHNWDELIANLSPQYRVIAYDLRGHGRSARPPFGYSLKILAEDLHELLDKLGITRPVLVGHSYGGLIALSYAIRYEVDKLILIASGLRTLSLGRRLVVGPLFIGYFMWSEFISRRWLWIALDFFIFMQLACITPELISTEIPVPALIICGDRDQIYPPKYSMELRDKLERSQLVVIQGAGHMMIKTHAEQIARIMLEFLEC